MILFHRRCGATRHYCWRYSWNGRSVPVHHFFTLIRFPNSCSSSLLSKLSYDLSKDVLISTGDIIAKGPLNGSLAVLSWMASRNVTAVRGNHDQKVIEWRSWINWSEFLS